MRYKSVYHLFISFAKQFVENRRQVLRWRFSFVNENLIMKQDSTENKNPKELWSDITFFVIFDILFFLTSLFEINDSLLNSIPKSFVIPLFILFLTLIVLFIFCLVASLVYATQFKEYSWMAFVPLLINFITLFCILNLLPYYAYPIFQTNNR